MNSWLRGILATGVAAGIMFGIAVEAKASIFAFDDIAYVSSSSGFSTAFPGYVGPPNYASAGYWQVIKTGNGNTWSYLTPGTNPPLSSGGLNNGSYIAKASANSSFISTEYIQNDPNNPPFQYTEGQDRLALTSNAVGTSNWTPGGGTGNGSFVNPDVA